MKLGDTPPSASDPTRALVKAGVRGDADDLEVAPINDAADFPFPGCTKSGRLLLSRALEQSDEMYRLWKVLTSFMVDQVAAIYSVDAKAVYKKPKYPRPAAKAKALCIYVLKDVSRGFLDYKDVAALLNASPGRMSEALRRAHEVLENDEHVEVQISRLISRMKQGHL